MYKEKNLPIIIVGGGLSGLLTAYRLKQAGIPVRVLEARGRPGGRIYTAKGADGPPLEMGATWFGKQHQNLLNLLEELKLSAFIQRMEGSVIFEASPFSQSQRIQIPPQDPSFRIVGGTSKIIQTLISFFKAEEISFNEQVLQISSVEEQVHVITNNRSFSARTVVCCLPPALMVESISFSPELPEQFLEEAINTHTWMQESIKAGVVYKTPFWRGLKVSTIVSHEGPVIEYYDHSNSANTQFALCGFLHPDFAEFSREEREMQVIVQLKRLFGKVAEEYTSYEEVVWQNEEFTNAKTGKIFMPHQNNGNSVFQKKLHGGKLLISNSETSPVHGGYMEGAVSSANKVAARIIEAEFS